MKLLKIFCNIVLISAPLAIGVVYNWHLSDAVFSSLVVFVLIYPIDGQIFFYLTTLTLFLSSLAYTAGKKDMSHEIAVWAFYFFILTWALSILGKISDNHRNNMTDKKNAK